MNTTLVSARIPQAKKERAGDILASLGVTASDLINSAYDYLITYGRLPMTDDERPSRDATDFGAFVEATTLDIPWPEEESVDYEPLVRG